MTLRATVTAEAWRLREPFETAGQRMETLPLLHLELADGRGHRGHAEAAGVDYDGETPGTMRAQIEQVLPQLHAGTSADDLAGWLPPGGARNALDCALIDLRAKRSGRPAWAEAGLPAPQPVQTACTIGLGSPAELRRRARSLASAPIIKLKVDARRHLDAVRCVRDEAPQARLLVDANQAWSRGLLEDLLPGLVREAVEMIEQPLPRGSDAALDGLDSPLPLVADESCTDRASLTALAGRYQGVNIKLDKCGGLTEALALAREARALGLALMVGNMCGTSLGMAPAFLVAQQARWVDLDGPLLQIGDRDAPMRYDAGTVHPPSPRLWG